MADYGAWGDLFSEFEGSEAELTFDELASHLGSVLPTGAFRYASWWQSEERARWRMHGWVENPDLRNRRVKFTRVPLPTSERTVVPEEPETHVFAIERRLIVVGGVSSQEARPKPARDMYRSGLWLRRKAYAVATHNPWRILSGEYGLLNPDTIIEPYEARRRTKKELESWSMSVARDVIAACRALGLTIVEVHARTEHLTNGLVDQLGAAGLKVSWPLRGRHVNEQILWYEFALSALELSRQEAEEKKPQVQATSIATAPPVADESMNGGAKDPVESTLVGPDVGFKTRVLTALVRNGSADETSAASKSSDAPTRAREWSTSTVSPVAASIASYGVKVQQERSKPEGTDVTQQILADQPYAFVVAIIMSRRAGQAPIWDGPDRLYNELGHLDPVAVADNPKRLGRAMRLITRGAPWSDRMSAAIEASARKVIQEYDGDASQIWEGQVTALDVRRRLESFRGIGHRQSRLGVELLKKNGFGLVVSDPDPITVSPTQRRVLLRAGLADFDSLTHAILPLTTKFPSDPTGLHIGLEAIGTTWCHEAGPECDQCAIGSKCPRLHVEAASVDLVSVSLGAGESQGTETEK